ncbi:MAG: alpha-galactosidase, partial [Ilumatobacteraceae bacterium]
DEDPLPTIVYWGPPLGDIDPATVRAALGRPITRGSADVVAPIAIVAEHGSGYTGRPGLLGRRQHGRDWAPRFRTADIRRRGDHEVEIDADDPHAGLRLTTRITLDHVATLSVELTNIGSSRYLLDQLLIALPLPSHARELLRFTGRWSREFQPVRHELTSGMFVIENRSGRPSQDQVPVVFVGQPGFGEWSGDVWGAHLAWSGDHQLIAQVLADGRAVLQLGELLHPGEIVIEPGQSYRSPEVYATASSTGLNAASWGFHRTLRARSAHPASPRPVLINTWEAVYFDHDVMTLRELATVAAAVGVERYVLDDGWFGARRDDSCGLGDWVVSPVAHPHGLGPLIAHVRSLGMDFGIWVEPEMVSPDSDLFRAHPDWALVDDGYPPVLARNQLVLNLADPDAYAHIRDQLHTLLRDHEIAFVKWDMNRAHIHASGHDGAAGTHAQTIAVYRLIDELRAAHPGVEFESCASGGGRVDFEILRRTDRVWASDCIDALERQVIQRGLSMFLPPELMGSHIGAPRAHTTGRTHSLGFRALTAVFGHLGIEWNLLGVDDRAREELASVIAVHKRFRWLLHSGDTVRFDPVPDGAVPSGHAHGVYSSDRREALVAVIQLRTGDSLAPPTLRLPGLDHDLAYRVEVVPIATRPPSLARRQPAWIADGIHLTGRQLAMHGVQLPPMDPETGILLHLTALTAGG